MTTDRYIKIGEAAKYLKTDVQYLHKLVKQNKLGAYYEQKGMMKYWYVDTEHERYQQLLLRLNPETKKEEKKPPTTEHPMDWFLWEAMCRSGEEIVKDRCSERTLAEYKRYAQNFFNKYPVLSRETLRASLMTYEAKATPEKDYYTARRMLHQAMMTVARFFVYKGFEKAEFVHDLAFLRPKQGNTVVSRPCHTEAVIYSAIEKATTAKNKKGVKAFSDYDEVFNQTIIKLAFYTAARNDEMCKIRMKDIDFVGGSLRLFGKGNKERYVGICEELEKALKYYLRIRPKNKSERLLLSSDGKPQKPAYISRRMKRLRKYLKNENFKPHSIRRTAITWMLNVKKIPMPIVRDAVGHSSLSVTNLYAQPSANDVIDAMKAL